MFPAMAILFSIPAENVQVLQFLYILTNICGDIFFSFHYSSTAIVSEMCYLLVLICSFLMKMTLSIFHVFI